MAYLQPYNDAIAGDNATAPVTSLSTASSSSTAAAAASAPPAHSHPLACELEENRVGKRVKMMTAYFSDLVQLQPSAAVAADDASAE